MAQPYVGEIRMFAGNFAPAGWMFCEGQLMPISENETLFQLIGTGAYVASALGVWAMALLAVTIIGASAILGRRLGALFRV